MMNRQVLWTAAILVVALLSLWNLSLMMGQGSAVRNLFDPLLDAYELIQQRFYRPAELDGETLLRGSLRGLMDQLNDPYSGYLSPDEYERFSRGLEGEFVGIGIHIGIRDGRLTVVSPIKGSPAELAGARAGDVILWIDESDAEGMTLDEAVTLLRGARGTRVQVEVRHRDGSTETLDIVRDVIHVPTVETRLLDGGTIGYLRLYTFNENAGADVTAALRELHDAGVEGLIFDLRDNGGGLLSQAVSVSSQFLDEGLVLTTTGPGGTTPQYTQGNAWENLPVAVLINGGTASASEIVAGALQDAAMGVLVGQQSFGKGVVQTLYPLQDGSYLRLTTSEYLTRLGRHVQGEGLTPDLPVIDPSDLIADAAAQLTALKSSLFTREAHALVDALQDDLGALFDGVLGDGTDLEAPAGALLDAFENGRALLLAASDGQLADALDELDATLNALRDALGQSVFESALAWLHAHTGERCPCEAPAQP